MMKTKRMVGYELGEVGTRLVAILIDGFILGLITGLLVAIISELGGGVSFLIGVLYNWYFWTQNDGQTPGKRIMNLRVVKADGSTISDTDALIRAVGYYISGLFFSLGYVWAIFDEQNRTWHDLFAGTIVVTAD